ncbi:thioester dehydrase [Colwellia sp. RSH04]|uniref:ApeI family dehydratase n=1 Tax=Colwellia sp. RSH04 TaxID=2305464 RepID=UPI000E56D29F|nr:thioester dehydrase [Colwellia sp. RSH04]RHW75790.1 thioester dehydrase [Colwellia sp. RSH04]
MNNSKEQRLPTITQVEQETDKLVLALTIDAELRCFKGHFDDAAIVPGVVQLDWAVTFAKTYLTMQGDVQDVGVLKFQNLLLPNTQVQLEIIKKSSAKFTFSYTAEDEKYSSARVELA